MSNSYTFELTKGSEKTFLLNFKDEQDNDMDLSGHRFILSVDINKDVKNSITKTLEKISNKSGELIVDIDKNFSERIPVGLHSFRIKSDIRNEFGDMVSITNDLLRVSDG